MEEINGKKYLRINDDGTLSVPDGFKLQTEKKKRNISEETRKKMSERAKSLPRVNGGKFVKKDK